MKSTICAFFLEILFVFVGENFMKFLLFQEKKKTSRERKTLRNHLLRKIMPHCMTKRIMRAISRMQTMKQNLWRFRAMSEKNWQFQGIKRHTQTKARYRMSTPISIIATGIMIL